MWMLKEEGVEPTGETLRVPDVVDSKSALASMRDLGFVTVSDQGLMTWTPKGEMRARGIIRRHRLAEKLFFEKFDMNEKQAEANACQLEHILSNEVTDSVCAFLGHPKVCPHNKPIPRGSCCS
ncbi:MAG TPA: iron dependent repressor, metal binding and dimerization domain protein [Blastocatellia bacterium]|nr:iron dependent repressor, metal binding and dimerization domain protein [Blastocatellia bacterium]